MFPSPRLRDNIIEHQATLDIWDLCYDLYGDLICIYTHVSAAANTSITSISSSLDATTEGDLDAVSPERCCLIVWGEPWTENSWEITPGFLRKWAWLLNRCDTLIESSNRWRAKRDEEPLENELDLGLGNRSRNQSIYALEVCGCMPLWHFVFADCYYSIRSWKIGRTHFSLRSQRLKVVLKSHHIIKHRLPDITQHPINIDSGQAIRIFHKAR